MLASVTRLQTVSISIKVTAPGSTFLLVVHRLCVSSVSSISGPVRQKDNYQYSV